MASLNDIEHLLRGTTIEVKGESEESFVIEFQEMEYFIEKAEVDEYLGLRDIRLMQSQCRAWRTKFTDSSK